MNYGCKCVLDKSCKDMLQQGIEYVGVNNGVICVYCKLNDIVQ